MVFYLIQAMAHLNLAKAELSGWNETVKGRGKRVLSHSLHSPQIHPGDAALRVARPQSCESRGHGCFVYYHDSFTW